MENIITHKQSINPTAARIATAAFFFLSGFNFATWASRIPTIKQMFHMNEAQMGNLLFAMPAGLVLTLPLTGFLLSKYSSRLIMFIGSLMFIWVLPWISFANTTWQLAIILAIFGSTRNIMNVALNSQSIEVQKLYNKSILTTFHGLWSLAGFLGAGLCTVMTLCGATLSTHFLIVSVFLTAISLIAYRYTSDAAVQKEQRPAFALPDKALIKIALLCFCSMSCEGTMFDWTGIFFSEAVKVSAAWVNCGYILYMCSMTSGRFLGDSMINRFGIPKILRFSGTLMAIGLFLAALFPNIILASIGCILVGAGVACVTPTAFRLAGSNKTMSTGSAIAAVSTSGYLGFLAGPPIIGYISHALNIRFAFAVFGLLGIGILILSNRVKK